MSINKESRQSRRLVNRAVIETLEQRRLLSALTIAQENALPGTAQSVWDVPGSGDSTIQGFTTDISVNVGQTVQFKIDDPSLAKYHIDIYRMGYYQGNGARKIATLSNTQTTPVDQANPLTDASTGLVDAGNWTVTASYQVAPDATSGIYFARVQREDTGGASLIVFVVRNDASHSDILFQTSDSTWQAYNQWGGNSLYLGSGPGGNSQPGRAYAVSYNRPIVERGVLGGYGADNFIFYNEYPVVRFLEKNGYDVSYFTDIDSDRYGSLILNHKTWMDTGHDEYISGPQRANLVNAAAHGVNLAFFSGNEMYWKTRLGPSIDATADSDRTLICYKESLADAKIDPSPIWTGLWSDQRFASASDNVLPANALTGTEFTVDRGPNDTGTPMTVPYSDAALRFWRNTAVANLQPGQVATLGTQVLGYEWDSDLNNGFRPAGLIDVSSTPEDVSQVITQYGQSTVPGVQTHSLTEYRTSSGAIVFGAGTVQWGWGLDSTHDGSSDPVDASMQQATINLLADMGAQPATLMAGMVAAAGTTDHTPPVTTIAFPANNVVVEQGGYATITGTAADSGGGQVAGVEISIDGGGTWKPAMGRTNWTFSWNPGSATSANILARATDDSLNIELPKPGVQVSLTIGAGNYTLWSPSTTPSVINDTDNNAIELGLKFRANTPGFVTGIRFYKGSQNIGPHTGSLWDNNGNLLATVTFTNESTSGWQEADFSSPVAIAANTTYVVSYHTTVGFYSDDSGYFVTSAFSHGPLTALAEGTSGSNGLYRYGNSAFPTASYQSTNYWVDAVFSASASVTPTIISENPANNATGADPGTTVSAQFNEAVNSASISFILTDSSNQVVATTLAYNSQTNTATLTPTAALIGGATYTASISGATDSSNHTMAPTSWTFSVAQPNSSISIFPSTAVPAVISDSDPNAVELGMKFRSSAAGSVTGVRFYKGSQNTGTHTGSLWDNKGNLLATITFSSESASGWQTANFSSPVAIAANTTYIISYHTAVGHYSDSAAYFNGSSASNGSLTALADGTDGPNGVYLYGSGGFPNQSFNATNYWVDVLFSASAVSGPAVTAVNPINGATGVSASSPITITFSKALDPTTVNTSTIQLLDSSNNVVASSVTYNAATNTATLTPTSALTASATYTVVAHGGSIDPRIKDTGGNALSANFTSTFSIAASTSASINIFGSTTPGTVTVNDNQAVELGVKFKSDSAGLVTGIRFYKGPQNIGVHTGTLWDSSGNGLATITFTNETASGWQQATFSTPVQIAANTVYIASYHTASGFYSGDGAYFASTGADSGPLHALSNAVAGGNGVYAYGNGSFPTSSFNSSNYWVDVNFSASTVATTPVVTAKTPAANATGVATNTAITVTFDQSVIAGSVVMTVVDSANAAVSGAFKYDDTTHTATFTPTALLLAGKSYTVNVGGASNTSGKVMSSVSWSFSTAGTWVQSTQADFNSGTNTDTAVTSSGVQLQQGFTDDFLGSSVNSSAWTTQSWASAGGGPLSVTVANSIVNLKGGLITSTSGFGLRSIQGVVRFGSIASQSFGLVSGALNTANVSSALFTTSGTTVKLNAVVAVNGASTTVSLGSIPSGYHTYKITPVSTGVQFYIDGTLKTTINVVLPNKNYFLSLSNLKGGSTVPALSVNSATVLYAATGSFVSSVFDASRIATWGVAIFNDTLPVGTSILIETSSGNIATPDGTWSAWSAVSSGGSVTSPAARYLHYRVTFTTTNPAVTALFKDITFQWT